jgi:hypothetical protein
MIMAELEGTEYYEKADEIAGTIYPRLEEILVTQSDESVSRQRHIGIYRQNKIMLGEIKADMAKLEKIVVTAGGPPAPEMLSDVKVKADSPTKTMTWIVIFVIILFVGLLAGVLFFTWQHQAKLTKDALMASQKAAFGGNSAIEEDKEA